jgi:hypothetical protein
MRTAISSAMAIVAISLSGCGPSPTDKANIRLAVSAFNRAEAAKDGNETEFQYLLGDFEKAADAIRNDDSRYRVTHCVAKLKIYRYARRSADIELELMKHAPTEADLRNTVAKSEPQREAVKVSSPVRNARIPAGFVVEPLAGTRYELYSSF